MKKSKNEMTLGNAWSPYSSGAESTMADCYEAYQADPNKYLKMDGKTFVPTQLGEVTTKLMKNSFGVPLKSVTNNFIILRNIHFQILI